MCSLYTPGYFFPQDIVWHIKNTEDKYLKPVRKQDLFGKMKQNIFFKFHKYKINANKVFLK